MPSGLAYLDYLRSWRYCAVCLKDGPVQVAHLDAVGMGGKRIKPSIDHYAAIPMCHTCHMIDFHNMTWGEFEKKHVIDLWRMAHRILREWLWSLENQYSIPEKDMRIP